jgi:hypothetical protein
MCATLNRPVLDVVHVNNLLELAAACPSPQLQEDDNDIDIVFGQPQSGSAQHSLLQSAMNVLYSSVQRFWIDTIVFFLHRRPVGQDRRGRSERRRILSLLFKLCKPFRSERDTFNELTLPQQQRIFVEKLWHHLAVPRLDLISPMLEALNVQFAPSLADYGWYFTFLKVRHQVVHRKARSIHMSVDLPHFSHRHLHALGSAYIVQLNVQTIENFRALVETFAAQLAQQ